MTGTQYEELCRRYVAQKFGIPLERVLSKNVPGAVRPGDTAYEHQIDLWWETGDEAVRLLYIADAKWRSTSKVDKPDVVLLEHARQDIGAQKAMMLTNSGFTEGAVGIADRHGIALHTVAPTFDASGLPTGSSATDRAAIAAALETMAAGQTAPLYNLTVVHRGFEVPGRETADAPPSRGPVVAPSYVAPARPAAPAVANRGPAAIPSVNRAITGGSNRGGGGAGGGRGGGFFGR